MAEKIKKASPYFLILVFVGLLIAFNFWSALDKDLWKKYVEADVEYVGSSVSVGNVAPTIEIVNVYGIDISTVVLTENSAIDLLATVSINDENGCTDVYDVEAWFLTSDIWWNHTTGGTSCTYDENNCYDNTVVSCSYASCAGITATWQCVASSAWQYFADATQENDDQASKTWEEWIVIAYASDSAGNDVTSDSWLASDSANVNLYSALEVEESASGSIPYGTLNPGDVSSVITRGIKNSGNRGFDPIIEEYGSMSLNGQDEGTGVFNTARQQYNSSTFTITGTVAASLSADNLTTALNLELAQRGAGANSYTSVSDDQLYWGIDVEVGQYSGDYEGSVSYTSVAD